MEHLASPNTTISRPSPQPKRATYPVLLASDTTLTWHVFESATTVISMYMRTSSVPPRTLVFIGLVGGSS